MDTQELIDALSAQTSDQIVEEIYTAMMAQIGPDMPADEESRLKEKWFKHVHRFRELAAQQYETMFDHKELQAIWAWTISATGKKLRSLAPQVSAEGARLGREIAEEVIMEMVKDDEDNVAEFFAEMKSVAPEENQKST